jgi:hypothetical protein
LARQEGATFSFTLDRAKCGGAKSAICCAPISTGKDPAELWRFYIQLVEIEAAFKTKKDDLQLRPIPRRAEPSLCHRAQRAPRW